MGRVLDNDELPTSPLDPRDDARARAEHAARVAAWAAKKDADRETGYVHYVLKELSLAGSKAAWARQAKETGAERVNLAWMCQVLRGWPMWLVAAWVPFVYRTFWPKFHKAGGVTKTPIYRAFADAKALAPYAWDEVCGVVFTSANCPGARGAMVLHNWPVGLDPQFPYSAARVGRDVLVVESLATMVGRLRGRVTPVWAER